MDASLSLFYNSLVWHRSTNPSNGSTWITYDVDSGYPGQGFRLGYGQIEDQGSAGFTLAEKNGTRRALAFTSTNNYATTDGSFITFAGGSGWGTLSFPVAREWNMNTGRWLPQLPDEDHRSQR